MVKLLLDKGARVDRIDKRGNASLNYILFVVVIFEILLNIIRQSKACFNAFSSFVRPQGPQKQWSSCNIVRSHKKYSNLTITKMKIY